MVYDGGVDLLDVRVVLVTNLVLMVWYLMLDLLCLLLMRVPNQIIRSVHNRRQSRRRRRNNIIRCVTQKVWMIMLPHTNLISVLISKSLTGIITHMPLINSQQIVMV